MDESSLTLPGIILFEAICGMPIILFGALLFIVVLIKRSNYSDLSIFKALVGWLFLTPLVSTLIAFSIDAVRQALPSIKALKTTLGSYDQFSIPPLIAVSIQLIAAWVYLRRRSLAQSNLQIVPDA